MPRESVAASRMLIDGYFYSYLYCRGKKCIMYMPTTTASQGPSTYIHMSGILTGAKSYVLGHKQSMTAGDGSAKGGPKHELKPMYRAYVA